MYYHNILHLTSEDGESGQLSCLFAGLAFCVAEHEMDYYQTSKYFEL